MIDLRSDTVTKPSKPMLEAMMNANVGDDVFSEDPTVKALEEYCAALFGMEAGLFCPSGTMSNQIAVKAQTQPLDEIICDHLCHIYNYETAGYAFHSGVSVRLTQGKQGVMRVKTNCRMHFTGSRLVSQYAYGMHRKHCKQRRWSYLHIRTNAGY
jgi:threonine aldolase